MSGQHSSAAKNAARRRPPPEPEDPYKIADVYPRPWMPEEDLDYVDDTEWPGADYDARTVARGKSAEARNRTRQYLAMNGAAVWKRVEQSLAEAQGHRDTHPAASIVASVTAAELIIRFLLLRPLIAGFVFHTKLAMLLVREGYALRTDRDRRLLPDVCSAWGFEIEGLVLPNGQPMWRSLRSLIDVRNDYVHRAESVDVEHARGAFDCTVGLVDQVVKPLATHVGLTWPPTQWTHKGRTHDPVIASFDYMGS